MTIHHLNSYASLKTLSFKVNLILSIINCLHYNPTLTFSILESNSLITPFYQLWMSNLKNFKRVHDIRLNILTICKILHSNVLPRNELLKGALDLLSRYDGALAERKRVKDMMEGEEDFEDGFYDRDYDDQSDFDSEEDEGGISIINEVQSKTLYY